MVTSSTGETTVVGSETAGASPGGALAVFTISPLTGTVAGLVTTIVAVALPPPGIDPSAQVTDVVPVQPPLELAETSVAPGKASATDTFVAGNVALLVTVRW